MNDRVVEPVLQQAAHRQLAQAPYRYRLQAAVQILLRSTPRPVGGADRADHLQRWLNRAVRFGQHVSLGFPASEIQRFQPGEGGLPARLLLNLPGLTGALGVLPTHYSELLQHRAWQFKDQSAAAFLDLFQHRLTSLFVAASDKYRVAQRQARGAGQFFDDALLDLAGIAGQLRQDTALAGLRFYGGLLGQRPIPAQALVTVLSDHFGVRFTLQPFQGQWLPIADSEQTLLGGAFAALGQTTLLGARVWDCQSRLQLTASRLSAAHYAHLLPGQPGHQQLQRWLSVLISPGLACDVRLEPLPTALGSARLGGHAAGVNNRLGWTTCLGQPTDRGSVAVVLKAA